MATVAIITSISIATWAYRDLTRVSHELKNSAAVTAAMVDSIGLEDLTKRFEDEFQENLEAQFDVLGLNEDEKKNARLLVTGEAAGLRLGSTIQRIIVEDVLAPVANEVGQQLGGSPLIHASLLQRVGEKYSEIGDHKTAVQWLGRSKDLYEARLGERHPSSLRVASKLAAELMRQKIRKGHELSHRIAKLQEEILGPHHPDTIETLSNLSTGWLVSIDESAGLCEEVVLRCVRAFGEDDRRTASARGHLALFRSKQNRAKEAESLYRRAISTLANNGEGATLMALQLKSDLAVLLGDMQQYEEACEISGEVISVVESKYGYEINEVLKLLENHASLAMHCGKDGVQESYARIAQLKKLRLGPWHSDTLVARMRFAAYLGKNGNHEEAEKQLREIVTAYEERHLAHQQPHIHYYQSRFFLAKSYRKLGKFSDAIATLAPIVEDDVWEAHLAGHDVWRQHLHFRAQYVLEYGFCLMNDGQEDEAKSRLRRSYEIAMDHAADDPRRKRLLFLASQAAQLLAKQYSNSGKTEEATHWASKAANANAQRGG